MKYYKLIWKYNFLFAIFYTLLFFMVAYLGSYVIGRENYERLMYSSAESFGEKVEASIINAQDLSQLFGSISEVESYVCADEPDGMQIMDVEKYLSHSISVMPSINSIIGIVNLNNLHVINQKATMELSYFCKEVGMSQEDMINIAKELDSDLWKNACTIITKKDDKDYFLIIYYDSSSFKKPYMMVFVSDIFNMCGMRDNASAALMLDNEIIYQTGEKMKKAEQYFEYSFHIRDFPGDFKTLYWMPKSGILNEMNKLLPWIFIAVLAVFFVSLYIQQNINRKIYVPVQNVINDIGGNDSQENEMDFIRNTVKSLEDRNTGMHNIIESYKIPVRENIMRSAVYGIISESELSEGLARYKIDAKKGPINVVLFKYVNYDDEIHTVSSAAFHAIDISVKMQINDIFAKYSLFESFKNTQDSYLLIICAEDVNALKKDIIYAVERIEENAGIKILAVVGSASDNWFDINASYRSAENMMQKNCLSQEESSIMYASENTQANEYVFFDDEMNKMLIGYVLKCEREQTKAVVSDIVEMNYSGNIISKDKHSSLVILIVGTCLRILALAEKKQEDIFPSDTNMYLELRGTTNKQQFKEKIYEMLSLIMDSIDMQKMNTEKKAAIIINNYIEENFVNDIALVDLAAHMNMSLSYMSKMFKSIMGENFKEYLAERRTEEAKKMLIENPSMSVEEIAHKCGFNNTDTFTRVFSKHTMLTPAQYRKNV